MTSSSSSLLYWTILYISSLLMINPFSIYIYLQAALFHPHFLKSFSEYEILSWQSFSILIMSFCFLPCLVFSEKYNFILIFVSLFSVAALNFFEILVLEFSSCFSYLVFVELFFSPFLMKLGKYLSLYPEIHYVYYVFQTFPFSLGILINPILGWLIILKVHWYSSFFFFNFFLKFFFCSV